MKAIADQLAGPGARRSIRRPASPTTRKALPADHFPTPFANETAARAANNNALPPDLSLITKAREGGPAYVYSLLTGYRDPPTYRNENGEALPAENRPGPNLHLQSRFREPQHRDAAAAHVATARSPTPTAPKPTVDQMAQDVAAFLTWTAEPRLENRHRTASRPADLPAHR